MSARRAGGFPRSLAAAAGALLLSGCALLPMESSRVPKFSSRSGPELSSPYREAIGKGHLFVAHDVVADARGFLFLAERGGAVQGVMGDEVRFAPGLRLYAYLPSPGRMTLFKDGKEVARAQGQHGWFEAASSGAYRLEAERKGRPWVYSNPIYVLE